MLEKEELRSLLEANGWKLYLKRVYKSSFAYARKRVDGLVKTRYLKAESKLAELTPEEVLRRISK